jgi:release factor glutamine methyltransferase
MPLESILDRNVRDAKPMSADPEHVAAATISIAAARRALAREFREAGLDTPDLDARVLIGHALGLDHTGLVTASGRLLDAVEHEQVMALAARRLAREPVARIVGVKEFWGLTFALAPAVLVPRPDTETVIEAALAAIDVDGPRDRTLRIADIGTGSGALLLALLSELRGATGVGTDVSMPALMVAQHNAAFLGLASRAAFVACDFAAALNGPFDLIVSNPPYVASLDLPTLAPEVRDHDPRLALDGGRDGLDAYRTIAAETPRLLAAHGHLVVELGAGQADRVAAVFAGHGLAIASPARIDLAGIARALHIKRSGRRAIAHGGLSKKRLEYCPIRIRFRPRNRPEKMVARPNERPGAHAP